MLKIIGKFLLFAVIAAGGLFSAINTYSLFQSIFGSDLPGILTSAAGLALFDVGALAWLLFFSNGAEGLYQRATAAIAAGACLLLTFAAAGMEVLLRQSLIETPEWAGLAAIVAILAALAVNLVGATVAHVTAPHVLEEIADRTKQDERKAKIGEYKAKIEREAFRQAQDLVTQNAGWVAAQLGEEIKADTIRELLGATPGGQNFLATAPQANAWTINPPAMAAVGGGEARPPAQPAAPPATAAPAPSAPLDRWEDDPQPAPTAIGPLPGFTQRAEAPPAPKA